MATTVAAPESCALYLGGELWGTGALEGTKLQVLIWLTVFSAAHKGMRLNVSTASRFFGRGIPGPVDERFCSVRCSRFDRFVTRA